MPAAQLIFNLPLGPQLYATPHPHTKICCLSRIPRTSTWQSWPAWPQASSSGCRERCPTSRAGGAVHFKKYLYGFPPQGSKEMDRLSPGLFLNLFGACEAKYTSDSTTKPIAILVGRFFRAMIPMKACVIFTKKHQACNAEYVAERSNFSPGYGPGNIHNCRFPWILYTSTTRTITSRRAT